MTKTYKLLFPIFIFCFIVTCSAQDLHDSFHLADGIWFENMDTSNKSPLRFTADNTIYQAGCILTYDLKIKDKDNQPLFCNFSHEVTLSDPAGRNFWQLVETDKIDSTTIQFISYRVIADPTNMEMSTYDPNYEQTYLWIDYKNYLKNTFGYFFDSTCWNPRFQNKFIPAGDLTGVVENKKNIWVHPPRTKFFEITQLNPYPYVQLPLQMGKKWSFEMNIGSQWGSEKWAEWKGNVAVLSEYEVKSFTKRSTIFGVLDCYQVECIGKTRIGNTKLVYYFNDKYGFVFLEYTNIDNSTIILELIEKTK